MKRPRRALVVGSLAAIALVALLAAAGAAFVYRSATTPFPKAASGVLPRSVDIASGESATAILRTLEAEGLIARADVALLLLKRLGGPPLQAGEYRFEQPASTRDVLERLIAGDVVQHPVTVVEGLTLEETADLLASAGFGDESAFLAAMREGALVSDLDPAAETLEGYLFPDTYAFARGTAERQIVAEMLTNFRRRYATLVAEMGSGLADPRATVTLASIVERETTLDAERALVAGVYANRLRLGMALYADPTVIYALKQLGTWDGNLRRVDLEIDSPYNTYRYPGLPPGPIASPGLASLRAAAAPADVPYLYFVSRNDGSHVFAQSLAEHNRNVDTWQRRYFRERGRQSAGQPPESRGD